MIKRKCSPVNFNRVTIPKEFRQKLGIGSDDTVIVEFDDSTDTLTISPTSKNKVKCAITGRFMEIMEAIPIDPDKGVYISRQGLFLLYNRNFANNKLD